MTELVNGFSLWPAVFGKRGVVGIVLNGCFDVGKGFGGEVVDGKPI